MEVTIQSSAVLQGLIRSSVNCGGEGEEEERERTNGQAGERIEPDEDALFI